MKLQVIYSSRTGNTKKVATAIAAEWGVQADAIGTVNIDADMVAIGYWVDKGQPNAESMNAMKELAGKKVFLFGTLGAEPDSKHASDCMANARSYVEEKNEIIGEFICQGAIDPKLIEMFKSFPPDHPHAITPERLERYARAATRPDERDLEAARTAARNALHEEE